MSVDICHISANPLAYRRRGGGAALSSAASAASAGSAGSAASSPSRGGGAVAAAAEAAVLVPLEQLDLRREKQLLLDALAEARRHVRVRFASATSDNLRKMVTLGCRALHYSGHGLADQLVFEDGYGVHHALGVDALRGLLVAGGGVTGVRFAFVSACHSQAAGEAFAAAGVPHVVAVQQDKRVSDHASRLFALHFYLALLGGKTVRASFDIGQSAVAASPEIGGGGGDAARDSSSSEPRRRPPHPPPSSAGVFLLLPADGDHDVTVFDDLPSGPDAGVLDLTPPAPRNGFERQPSFFVGRNLECQSIYEQLVRGARCVTILGQPGIGKTAAAARVCDYCTERRVFCAIFMVQFEAAAATAAAAAAVGDEDAACFLRRRFQAAAGLHHGGGRELLGEEDMFRALDGIGGRERVLFAVDGIDAIAANGSPMAGELRSFLGRLLKGTSRVHLLITGSTGAPVGGAYLPGNVEKVVQIRGLGERDAAMLLTARAPRKLALNEIGADRVADALACLSRHPAVRSLCGHPR